MKISFNKSAINKTLLANEVLPSSVLLMDLQWFAAEDEGRTFEPTETTYRKAREEGRVSKSQDLVSALGLLLPVIALFFLAPGMLKSCIDLVKFFFTRATELDPLKDEIVVRVFFSYFIRLALPILLVAVFTAVFSNYMQISRFGLIFATKPITPDFSKIVPKFGKYLQRTMFSAEAAYKLVTSIAKMGIIGVTAYLLIRSQIDQLVNLQTMPLWTSITIIAALAAKMMIICAVLLLVLSIPDIFFQSHQFKESLKMSREQAKEEHKQEEGDPQVRARLKRRYQELLAKDLSRVVPQANVVITNPTHYSVALLYEEGMEGPMVIAKGEDELAFRIRELAKANDVPVVAHPPLTRAIYAETNVGDLVPVKYWQVMILLLGKFLYVDKKRKEAARPMRPVSMEA